MAVSPEASALGTWASPESTSGAGSMLDDIARLTKLLAPDAPHVVRVEMGAKAWERTRAMFPHAAYQDEVRPPMLAAAFTGVTVVQVGTWGPGAVVAVWSDGRLERLEG